MSVNADIKKSIPEPLKKIYRRLLGKKELISCDWQGSYASYAEAAKNCGGYNTDVIYEKVYEAACQVKDGKAAYERDSFLFDTVHHNWPLLACLLQAALQMNKPSIRVLDFGGALGTTYFTVKKFLANDITMKWVIVEQPRFVKVGKSEFENEELTFEYDLTSVFGKEQIDVVLLSGVLQYLESPHEFLTTLSQYAFKYLLLDRTFFINDEADRIVIQNVPEYIYPASYPCYLFNENKLSQQLTALNYKLISDFKSQYDLDQLSTDKKLIYHKGFYFRHG